MQKISVWLTRKNSKALASLCTSVMWALMMRLQMHQPVDRHDENQ